MKQWIACVLCLALLCACLPSGAECAMDALTIGSPTQFSGDFFTDMWGNNTADMDVRALVHGYSTVAFNGEGHYQVDMNVSKDVQLTDDRQGNRTYTFTLNDALTYCDGSKLTAKDYVFSVLLLADPRMTDLGGVPGAMAHLTGFGDYVKDVRAGKDKACFSGVRMLSEYQFSVTISKQFLPYYYELVLANVQPYPMQVIAPGCDVGDDGQGAYLTGPFSAELLQKTVLDPDTGYRFFPSVTSGPYVLTSYDREAHVARLELNPHYMGNFEGQKPEIQKLTIQMVRQADMMQRLVSGEVDLINKVSAGDQINRGLEAMREGKLSSSNYLRTGLSFLAFACEGGLTQSVNIRRAIALCVDEQGLVDQFLKGYGLVSYGYYGNGQWMAADMGDDLLQLAQCAINTNATVGLLEKEGWTLREDGTPYDDELGGVRFRKAADGSLEKLAIRLAVPDNSDAGKCLAKMLETNMSEVGFALSVTELPYAQLLKHYYRQVQRGYDMFFAATNFNMVFDPYDSFSTEEAYQGVFNTTGIQDEKLMKLADQMRKTAPDDQDGYREKWLKFQKRFVEVLPMAPLYSNVYFDFFRPDLQNYRPNAHCNFASALLYAYLGEPRPETDAEGKNTSAGTMRDGADEPGDGEAFELMD